MPFAASDSLPHLCGACWHPKDAHEAAGDCPDRASKPPGGAAAPAGRRPR